MITEHTIFLLNIIFHHGKEPMFVFLGWSNTTYAL